MDTELVHIGFGNFISMNKVIAISSPNSAPIKRLIHEGKDKELLLDMTSGRKTKAVVITDTGHLILSALTPETIAARLQAYRSTTDVKLLRDEEEAES